MEVVKGMQIHGSSTEDGGKALDSNFSALATGKISISQVEYLSATQLTLGFDYTSWLSVGDTIYCGELSATILSISSTVLTVDSGIFTNPIPLVLSDWKPAGVITEVLKGMPNTVIYINSSGNLTFLPNGSEGQILSVVSGEPVWLNPQGGLTKTQAINIALIFGGE